MNSVCCAACFSQWEQCHCREQDKTVTGNKMSTTYTERKWHTLASRLLGSSKWCLHFCNSLLQTASFYHSNTLLIEASSCTAWNAVESICWLDIQLLKHSSRNPSSHVRWNQQLIYGLQKPFCSIGYTGMHTWSNGQSKRWLNCLPQSKSPL